MVFSLVQTGESIVKKTIWLTTLLVAVGMLGCSSPSGKLVGMRLGMTPIEVKDAMGKPDTVRAAKVFEDGQVTEVWEYLPAVFELNPKTFWIYFENARVVQWGEPGDFTGKASTIEEYKAFKKAN